MDREELLRELDALVEQWTRTLTTRAVLDAMDVEPRLFTGAGTPQRLDSSAWTSCPGEISGVLG